MVIMLNNGLGNQMFQYAYYTMLKHEGYNCKLDLSWYRYNSRECYKLDLFPNIDAEFIGKFCEYLVKPGNRIKWFLMLRIGLYKYFENGADINELTMFNVGYFQDEKYYREIKNQLVSAFTFPKGEDRLIDIADKIISQPNSVSVHIRRGDYLAGENNKIFGNICTLDYYRRAISIFDNNDTVFYVFSNDISWVKENLKLENAVYIDSDMFDNYEDWYDMYLMTLCKNNIISNSTFSWWGAYLNQNKNRKVVAPKRWFNIPNFENVCPRDWIRI